MTFKLFSSRVLFFKCLCAKTKDGTETEVASYSSFQIFGCLPDSGALLASATPALCNRSEEWICLAAQKFIDFIPRKHV